MKATPAILLALTLALPLAAAEAPAAGDPQLTSPSGRLHLRLGDFNPLPGAATPLAERAGEDGEEGATQTLVLEEKGRPPFIITAPEGRTTPH